MKWDVQGERMDREDSVRPADGGTKTTGLVDFGPSIPSGPGWPWAYPQEPGRSTTLPGLRPQDGCPEDGRPGAGRPGDEAARSREEGQHRGRPPGRTARWTGAITGSRACRHAALIACYLAAGIAATWPRASFLAGDLPSTRDAASYVWGFWWVVHQVIHLANPWASGAIAAPVGTQLAYDTLMPLPALVMAPVTLMFGPSVTYNLLSIACPGLLCYVTYRAARLWLPTGPGAIAAGAFFGLSSNLAWRSWNELNLALGALFLPMALEAAVRLCRTPGRRQAIILGAVLGTAMLVDQESAILAAILAALVVIPRLVRQASWAGLRRVALAGAVGIVAASPQLAAMIWQAATGGARVPMQSLARSYAGSGVDLVQMFAPSPRLAAYGMPGLASLYYHGNSHYVVVGYGLVLSLLAVAGLVLAWPRRGARQLALLWLCCSVLALGGVLIVLDRAYHPFPILWHRTLLSALMPYSWLVRLPGLANFREADRFAEIGLLAAALLAGAAVNWLAAHARPVLGVVLVLGALEAGWSGNIQSEPWPIGTMPTAMPALDAPIAADHSGSIVVDVPFGLRGGVPVSGVPFPPESMVLATADGHPLAEAYVSRLPPATIAGISHKSFYAGLMRAQSNLMQNHGRLEPNTRADLRHAWHSARRLHVGWVLVWYSDPAVVRYLYATGFRFSYRAEGVSVYRPVTGPWSGVVAAPPSGPSSGGPPAAPPFGQP
jgi:hypothetical protein